MIAARYSTLFVLVCCLLPVFGARGGEDRGGGGGDRALALRIATFNIEDVRSGDLDTPDNPRLKQLAAIIQRIRPNILLLNELAVEQNDGPTNAEKFAYNYLAVSQGEGLRAIGFKTYTPPTNTGVHSGFDLDRSGGMIIEVPEQGATGEDGAVPAQTPAQREYGNDCFGFGTFPGQYGMALFVDPRLTIDTDHIRTFQHFLWKDLPGLNAPVGPDGTPWYGDDAWAVFRLASKNFADVPITLPNGTTLHALISHPTPPAFDGDEKRNVLRNHDEIKLIRAYIDNEPALYDDAGVHGGLGEGSSFVIMGDLNADPSDGSSVEMTIFSQLFSSPRVGKDAFPSSPIPVEGLDKTDTARFGLRVDYVLPSGDIEITDSGVWRDAGGGDGPDANGFPSDHFPVWIEAIIP